MKSNYLYLTLFVTFISACAINKHNEVDPSLKGQLEQKEVCPKINCPTIYIPPTAKRKISKVYYLDGKLFSETNLFTDKYNGFYKTYHPNGQLSTEVRYKDGWQVYDKAFDEHGLAIIRNGVFKTYYADGHLASAAFYHNDLKNGKEEDYYYDGTTIVDIWHYMNGRRVASHIRNDASGNFVSKEDWGYPTYYVQDLKYKIQLLRGLALLIFAWLIFKIFKNRQKTGTKNRDTLTFLK